MKAQRLLVQLMGRRSIAALVREESSLQMLYLMEDIHLDWILSTKLETRVNLWMSVGKQVLWQFRFLRELFVLVLDT